MNGRYPIDDLFSRGLRDAEATPPPAVWQGIARKRGLGHVMLLRLRQRWALSALLLLLLGGIAAYGTGTGTEHSTRIVAASNTPQRSAFDEERSMSEQKRTLVSTGTSAQPAPARTQGSGPSMNLSMVSTTPTPLSSGTTPSTSERPADRNSQRTNGGRIGGAVDRRAQHSTDQAHALDPGIAAPGGAVAPVQDGMSTGAVNSSKAMVYYADQDPLAVSSAVPRNDADDMRAQRVPWRPSSMDRTPLAGNTRSSLGAPYVLPSSEWWFGVQAGYSRENREWHGTNTSLAEALSGTEMAHYPWSVGVMAGRMSRSGWGFAAGVEYSATRYDFRHDDRIVQRTQTTTAFVVTLDTMVVANVMDTVVHVDEQHNKVDVINRSSAIRVPLEVSYHKPFGRWNYGLRAGVAAEFVTMRSGRTLASASADGGEYSVDLADAPNTTRTSSTLSATLGADLGYMFAENTSLWLMPAWTKGVLPIAGDKELYALPERFGLTLRLTYTLPTRR